MATKKKSDAKPSKPAKANVSAKGDSPSVGPRAMHFDPLRQARLSLEHLTAMTDPALGHLPWGTVNAYIPVPFAEHSRRDDAEFAATWYEGISCAREILRTNDGLDVEKALRGIVLDPDCWDGATGLRFPKRRAWTGDIDYATISEMTPVLSALNRMIECDPKDAEARARAEQLVDGLRRLVVSHKERLTPVCRVETESPLYHFPCDVVIRGRGFAPEYDTGYADSLLRVSTLIHPLMVNFSITGSKAAFDLALGLANRITGCSHVFSHKTEFQGEVHSALVACAGLAAVGRVLSRDRYVARAKALYDYVRRNSSSFGWTPEFLQWQLIADELCPAAVTADMMILALELVECSFPEYWDDVHRFWRNHLVQMQFDDTSFVPSPVNVPEDTDRRTYRDIGRRMRGAFTGASSPSFVQLNRQRSFSAQSSAAAPRGMLWAWRRAINLNRDLITLNLPIDIETDYAKVTVGYPENGTIRIDMKGRACRINLRVFPWMSGPHEGYIGKRPAALERREDHTAFPVVPANSHAEFSHDVKLRRIAENITGLDFYGLWRGPDVIDILPHLSGPGVRLYQNAADGAREPVPPPNPAAEPHRIYCEPPVSKETRLNRRKAPRG